MQQYSSFLTPQQNTSEACAPILSWIQLQLSTVVASSHQASSFLFPVSLPHSLSGIPGIPSQTACMESLVSVSAFWETQTDSRNIVLLLPKVMSFMTSNKNNGI